MPATSPQDLLITLTCNGETPDAIYLIDIFSSKILNIHSKASRLLDLAISKEQNSGLSSQLIFLLFNSFEDIFPFQVKKKSHRLF